MLDIVQDDPKTAVAIVAATCPFRMYGPPPVCKWIFCELVSNQSAVMYPAPEHSLWP
jgi:hypothetical protein